MVRIPDIPSRLLTRRGALGLAGGAAASAATLAATWQVVSLGLQRSPASAPVNPQRDAGRPVPYGAAVHSHDLPDDFAYQQALARYCQEIVPEYGLKWVSVRPQRGRYDWGPADTVIDFGRQHNLGMRGHTLVWEEAMPDWTKEISGAAEAERELVTYIEKVVSRYRGVIHSWDVVNEPLLNRATSAAHHRNTIWYRYLGERYLDIAFRTAAGVDPKCQLVINEYGIESTVPGDKRKRQAYRDLLRRLRDKGLPLHGVGIQAHIHAENAIDRDGLSSFVSEVKAMGLTTLITELDMIDKKLPAQPEVRDILCAARTYELLDAVFSADRPAAVVTWGITDRRTWVTKWNKRDDGLATRPLPLDAEYQPKPMWRIIEHFCRSRA